MLQSIPHLKNSQIQMAIRRSSQGSGPKSGSRNPQTPAPACSDRLSQLEKDMTEIRDGTTKEVLEKLRLLSDEIEDINDSTEGSIHLIVQATPSMISGKE